MPYIGAEPDKGNFADLNGGKLILDADADTSITADTDDQIDIEIAGSDELKITATMIAPASADGSALGGTSNEWSDLYLADGGVVYFGTDQDVTITHVHNDGLIIKSIPTADNNPLVLTLQTGETTMVADEPIAQIHFQSPDEASGTDAILIAATIQATAEGNWSSSSNATSLDFYTGNSAAAGSDGGSMILGSTGNLTLKDLRTADGSSPTLTLQTGDTDIAANDIIGSIEWQAPDEGTGTDAILVSAAIKAYAEGDHSSSSNATTLGFYTGASEAAAIKMSLSSAGALDVTGDITGSTINADGDTAAGDNAAMGYTASEGLILTGQGSTDDITIKNDADTTVVNVATGATDVEISAGNILFGTGSKGVYLGVTSATAANLLDDYEEGTFTPAYTFGGSTTGITFGTNGQKGRYTKIGRFVAIDIYIGLTDKGSQSGNISITGFPFTSVNDGFNTSAVAHVGAFTGGWDLSAEAHFTGAVQQNSSTCELREGVFSTDTNPVGVTAAMATDDGQLYMSLMYEAA